MIGIVERDEALGMLGGLEDAGGVYDADGGVDGRMKDQERFLHGCDVAFQLLPFEIFQELQLDAKRPPGEQHLGLAFGLDFGPGFLEKIGYVGRIGRCPDGADGFGLGHPAGCGQNRRAAK